MWIYNMYKHTPPTFHKLIKKMKNTKEESFQPISSYHTTYTHSHNVIHHTPHNHWKSFKKSLKKGNLKKSQQWQFFCVSLTNVRHSRGIFLHFKSKIQVLLLYIGPLRGNDHRFLYIKALYKAMVIDFFFTLRPSTINLFTSRHFARQ